MAAPKNPSVTNAAAARRRIGDEAAAARLRAAGWFVASPEEIAQIEAEEWGPGMIAEWYARKVDAAQPDVSRHRRFAEGEQS
jgi:hypothetical protein